MVTLVGSQLLVRIIICKMETVVWEFEATITSFICLHNIFSVIVVYSTTLIVFPDLICSFNFPSLFWSCRLLSISVMVWTLRPSFYCLRCLLSCLDWTHFCRCSPPIFKNKHIILISLRVILGFRLHVFYMKLIVVRHFIWNEWIILTDSVGDFWTIVLF